MPQAIDEAKRENERKLRGLTEEGGNIRIQMTNLDKSVRETSLKIGQATREIEGLDSQAGQQEAKLRRIGPDTWKAWQWVKKNQHLFEKPILGPPIVECSVKDPGYVDLVETLIQQGDMITLTAQTKDDQKKLHNIVKNELRCGRTNTRCAFPLSRFQPPVGDEQRKDLGFDGWALDYLQGPEPVLAMLCEAAALHRTGVALQDISAEKFQQLQDSPIPQWITGRSMYRINRRREYGPGAVSTTVRDIRKAQVWTNQPVDMSLKQELQQKIDTWQDSIKDMKNQVQEFKNTLEGLRKKRDDIEDEQKELTKEKEAKQAAAKSFNALPVRIARQEETRKENQTTLDNVRARLEDLQTKQDDTKLDKARAALDFASSVESLQQTYEALQEADIMLIEARSDVETLERNNLEIKEQLEAKRAEVDGLNNTMQVAKTEAKKAYEAVQKLKAEANEALSEFFDSFDESQTIDQLEGEIDAERARLDLMHGGDSNVIVQYEEREKKIAKMKEKLERIVGALQEIGQKITDVRQKWEPRLDELVKRISSSFSYNMAQISCNGQVGVQKEEDFDQWAIIIHVRFR